MDKLLPCPFCGGEASLRCPPPPVSFRQIHYVCCNSTTCQGSGPATWGDDADKRAIEAWTTRARPGEDEKSMIPKQFPTCPSCGSDDINAETPCAVFDIELQRWVAQDGEVDNFFCNACQMEFGKPVWQNVKKGGGR